MKKILFSFAFLFHIIAIAQKIDLGAKAGLNFSRFDQLSNKELLLGINGGIFATVSVRKIRIQPEILYSQQGSISEIQYFVGPSIYIGTSQMKSKFSYLTVPLLVKYYPIGGFNIQNGASSGIYTCCEK